MARRRGSGFWRTSLGQAVMAGGIVAVILLTVLAGIVLTYQEQLAWSTATPTATREEAAAPSPTATPTPSTRPPTRVLPP
ncbi:MAG: hypothetical protein H5T59_10935, partial [Anaerolineae bacterium]|nr:hypothetical protein [Anaerolineae bacterium]